MNGLTVGFRIKGLSAEKLMNEARKRGIALSGVRRLPGRGLTAQCAQKDYAALCGLAEEKGFSIGPARPLGALRGLRFLRRRWGLLPGAVCFLILTVYALGFVWQVRIENAGAYEGEVRAFLRDVGIAPGVRRSQVRPGEIRDALEWRLPRVQWVRAALEGVTLRITIEEGVPPPDNESQGATGDVVAAEDGLILRLVTFAGTPRVKPGDFVRSGQVIIAGVEKSAGGEGTPVKARGSALARVWRTEKVRLPLDAWRSLPTGRAASRRVISSPFFSWSFSGTPDYLTADREQSEQPLLDVFLPLTLMRETYTEVALEKERRSEEEVLKEAEEIAMRRLNEQLKSEEIVDKWINFRMIEGDTIVVEAAGELVREIGRFRKTTP